MKTLFVKYRAVIRFIALFLGTYFILSAFYALYLFLSAGGVYYPDFVTHLVAHQSNEVLNGLGYNAHVVPNAEQPVMNLYMEGKHIARIVEGCNAISIIILFVAFIIAFSQRFKKTALYILAGSVLIYAVNIVRIVIFTISLYHYPQYESLLHGVIFPGIIYGMVFLLWINWVRSIKNTPAAYAEKEA